MARAAAGVVGSGDQATVGKELPGRGEAADAVDLGVDGKGVHLAEARDPQQPLDVGVGDQVRVQGALQRGDLRLEQRQLGAVAAGLELVSRLQLGHAGEVELLQQPIDAVLGADVLLDQP